MFGVLADRLYETHNCKEVAQMGQRANLIILEKGIYTLYYDHWAANSLDSYLFWGPDRAVSYFRSHEKSGEDYWLDTVWCEGGAVIDLDKKVLLFFGGEDIYYDVLLRRMYLKLMVYMWPGYEIRWAYNGILDLADYVHYQGADLNDQDTAYTKDMAWVNRLDDHDAKDLEGILSIKKDGKVTLHPFYGYDACEHLLLAGEGVLHEAEKRVGLAQFVFPNASPEEGTQFVAGIHIDSPSKTLFFWRGAPQSTIIDKLTGLWPGWAIIDLKDDFEEQEALTDGLLTFTLASEKQLLAQLRRIVCAPYSKGDAFVDELTATISQAADVVEVNPLIHATNLFDLSSQSRQLLFSEAVARMKSALS